MTACGRPPLPSPRKPLRSRSVRSGLPTSSRVKRCWMPALARTAICAPASACATDARPPKALPCRRWREGRLGRDRAVVARQRRGRPGAHARPAGGRQRLPQARGRGRADGPRARGGESAWPSRGDPARRRALLRPLRLLGREDRRADAARRRSSASGCSALELADGALDGAWGMIVPTGDVRAQAEGSPREEGAARHGRGSGVNIMPKQPAHRAGGTAPALPQHHHHDPAGPDDAS